MSGNGDGIIAGCVGYRNDVLFGRSTVFSGCIASHQKLLTVCLKRFTFRVAYCSEARMIERGHPGLGASVGITVAAPELTLQGYLPLQF
jgi:hypothetical protein